jgi:hypothetical protein
MLRCISCNRHHSEAATLEAAQEELDQILADESDAIDLSLCFDKLDDKAARALRSVALKRGLFVQKKPKTGDRSQLEFSAQRFPFRVGTTDLGQLGPTPNRRGKTLTAEEEGPDWTCAFCSYNNWRRRDTCRNCTPCPKQLCLQPVCSGNGYDLHLLSR